MDGNELMNQDAALAGGRDDGRLDELAANIRASESRNQQLAQMMLDNAVDIGRWLAEAKAMVPHGEWGKWLEEKVSYSQSKAQNLMRLYQEYGTGQESLFRSPNSQALGNLSVTKALRLLSIPDEIERDKFLEEHDVASMTTRELDAAIKERDAALLAAEQARADQAAAEMARRKMEEDMAMARRLLEEAQAERNRAFQDAHRHEEALAESERNITRLEKELEELRSRPVEVAVEADASAVETARKEAEEAMRAELDKAKKAQARAEEGRKAAEEAQAAAQKKLEQAQAEAQTIRERAEKAEKRAAVAGNEDLALFRTLFNQTQDLADKMSEVLIKVRKEAPENAPGLSRAMLALGERIKEAAGP